MASVNVTIRMDADDKAKAEKLFSELGLTMNAAFNMFIKQSIREQSIPFKVTKSTDIQYLDRKTLMELSEKSDKARERIHRGMLIRDY